VTTTPDLLIDGELMTTLRMSPRTFYRHKKAGQLDRFLVKRPIGRAIWSAKLVALHVDGESTVVLGGRRGLRRAS